MITQYEISPMLRAEIPAMAYKVYPVRTPMEAYASINDFSDFTIKAIEHHDLVEIKKCFSIAKRLYHQGDKIVRMLMENIFVHAFSSYLDRDNNGAKWVTPLVPSVLNPLLKSTRVNS